MFGANGVVIVRPPIQPILGVSMLFVFRQITNALPSSNSAAVRSRRSFEKHMKKIQLSKYFL